MDQNRMILARYLILQFAPPFFFGLTLFSGVLLLDKLFDLIDLLINKGASFFISLKIFSLFLPTVFTLSVPMSLLLASLLTFGRLSEDNEITALRASGLSFKQILWPPLLFAFLLSVLLVPFNTTLVPKAMGSFRTLYHKIVTTDPLIKIEPKQFISLRNIRLYTQEVSESHEYLTNIWLYQLFPHYSQRIYAKKGIAKVDQERFQIRLEEGQIERFSYDSPLDLLHIEFKKYDLSVPFLKPPSEKRGKSWREMNLSQLKETIQSRKKMNLPTGELEAEFHVRFSIAFAPLALTLLGIPLGMALEKGGKGVGFGASVGVIFGYYLLLIMGLSLAEKEALPALPALWISNVTVIILGLILYIRRLRK